MCLSNRAGLTKYYRHFFFLIHFGASSGVGYKSFSSIDTPEWTFIKWRSNQTRWIPTLRQPPTQHYSTSLTTHFSIGATFRAKSRIDQNLALFSESYPESYARIRPSRTWDHWMTCDFYISLHWGTMGQCLSLKSFKPKLNSRIICQFDVLIG